MMIEPHKPPDDDDYYPILARLCLDDLAQFVRTFWHVVVKEPLVWNWHMEVICDELQQVAERVFRREPKEYDLIINVPPGSSKSTLCSQMFPAWCWTRDATLRFIAGSYAYTLAAEQAEYHRQIVLNELYCALFPHVSLAANQNARHNFRTDAKGQRYSCGVGGTVLGIHAHIQLIDDPLNPKQAASKAELAEANRWMSQTLSGRKIDRAITPLILIMQRLHEDDPAGVALRQRPGEVRHICLPAECTGDVKPADLATLYKGGLLDPVRLSRPVLESAKIEMGSFGYSGQMLQRPVPEEGGILKKGWFKVIGMDDVMGLARQWLPTGTPAWNFVADLAYTQEEINDPSGVMAYARIGPVLVIRNAERFRLEQPDLERRLPVWCAQNGYSRESLLIIEPKANGISTIQNLRRRTALNVIAGKAPTKDKVSRIQGAAPLVESGRVMLLDGDWIDAFLDEVTTFPFASHDEFPDCLNIAIERETKAGLGGDRTDKANAASQFDMAAGGGGKAKEVWDGIV